MSFRAGGLGFEVGGGGGGGVRQDSPLPDLEETLAEAGLPGGGFGRGVGEACGGGGSRLGQARAG